jgi:hypothetical protein
VATGRFEMVVFACNVFGTLTHVFPPSVLGRNSPYAAASGGGRIADTS